MKPLRETVFIGFDITTTRFELEITDFVMNL